MVNTACPVFVIALSLFAFGLTNAASPSGQSPTEQPPKEIRACANLTVTASPDLKGQVNFTQMPDGSVRVQGMISGLAPGKHGFHVHEKSDLSEVCQKAGGHFNPLNVAHGSRSNDEKHRHVGDLGNINAESSGVATFDFVDTIIKLEGDHSIVGKSIVVHEREDDLGLGGHADSNTTGHAGNRLGCGVISGAVSIQPSAMGVVAMFSSLCLLVMSLQRKSSL